MINMNLGRFHEGPTDEKTGVTAITGGFEISLDMAYSAHDDDVGGGRDYVTQKIKLAIAMNLFQHVYGELREALVKAHALVKHRSRIVDRPSENLERLTETISAALVLVSESMPNAENIKRAPLLRDEKYRLQRPLKTNSIRISVEVNRKDNENRNVFMEKEGSGDPEVTAGAEYFEKVLHVAMHELLNQTGGHWVGTPPSNPAA